MFYILRGVRSSALGFHLSSLYGEADFDWSEFGLLQGVTSSLYILFKSFRNMFNLNISTYSPAQRMQYLFIGIFLVLNFAISYLGSHLLRHRVQHHLTIQRDDPKDKAPSVPINHLVPWLSIGDFATYIWYIRKIPGGRWGILMLGTAVFSLAQVNFTFGSST